jgi:excisionase family DNA binding protein
LSTALKSQYVSPPELAELVSRSPMTVRRWLEAGLLPSVRLPSGRRLIPGEAVEKLLTPTPARDAR